ncbi:MAG: leucine-rich repeat protein [Lachnospiraceae bacterium]|nr:leucine-rich repeat protein [Lachnospiraceae bacterium]
MESVSQEKKIIHEIGSLSDKAVSLAATLASGALLVIPAVMALLAMIRRDIDFTMYMYPAMIKYFVFPFACSVIFIIYIVEIIRMIHSGRNLMTILVKNPVFLVFSLFIVWIVISQCANGLLYAVTGFCSASLAETFPMELCYVIFTLFGATRIKLEAHKKLLLRIQTIVSCILVLAAFILWHTQVESEFFYDWTPRYSSIFSNVNYYGYYLALSVPLAGALFVYETGIVWKVIAGSAFAINTVALSLNNSMGAWVGGAFAVVFIVVTHLILEKKVNWQTLVLIPVFLLCMYLPSKIVGTFETEMGILGNDIASVVSGSENIENAGSDRIKLWIAAADIVKDNSMMGIGFEGVKAREYVGAPYNIRPHNEFIQYALFHGIPAAVLYFLGCFLVFIRALRRKKQLDGATLVCLSAAFGYLVSSCFGLTVFSTAYFLFIFLGMGYVSASKEEIDEENGKFEYKKIHLIAGLLIICAAFMLVLIFGTDEGEAEATGDDSERIVVTNPDDFNGNLEDYDAMIEIDGVEVPLVIVDDVSFYIDGDHAVVTNTMLSDYSVEELVIPEKITYKGAEYPVTELGEFALDGYDELKKIEIPASVKVLGNNSFNACESLENVTLNEGLEKIGDEAFCECGALTSLRMPSTVTSIGASLFYNCSSLKTVELPEGITQIPDNTFFGCGALKKVNLPKSTELIGINAFWECESLTEIELPEGLKSIDDDAFNGCALLTEVKIPTTLEEISASSFDYCDSLEAIYVPNEEVGIYSAIFDGATFEVRGY